MIEVTFFANPSRALTSSSVFQIDSYRCFVDENSSPRHLNLSLPFSREIFLFSWESIEASKLDDDWNYDLKTDGVNCREKIF